LSTAKLLAKIRALRALAASANVHEAAAAAAAATRLLLEHDLAETELANSDDSAEVPERAATPLDTYGRAVPRWRSSLANLLMRVHGCAGWLESSANDGGHRMVIVGRKTDVETVRYLLAWLVMEIEHLTDAHGKRMGRTWRNSYRWGAVAGIREQLDAVKDDVRACASSAALVVFDARQRALATLLPVDLQSCARAAPPRDAHAYAAGKRAGRVMHVGKSIDSRLDEQLEQRASSRNKRLFVAGRAC
jgi:hypothetical protein